MKKIFALVIAFLLSLNTFAVLANETMSVDTEYVENYEPEIIYEYVSDKTLVDTKEYDVRQLVVYYNYGDEDNYGELYVEIAPFARAFQYDVSYVEETDAVVFEKDGTKKEVLIPNSEIIENGDYDNWMYIDVISYEDRTYVSYNDVKKVIDGIYLNNDEWGYIPESEYSYHTASSLMNEYKDSFKEFERIYEITNKGVYTSKSEADIAVDFSVEDLGLTVSGACVVSESSLFENGKYQIDMSIDSDGLLNIIDIAMQIAGDEETEINFDEKIDFSIIFDSQNLYIKGDLNKLIAENEKPYFVDEEYELSEELRKLIYDAVNGWVKIEVVNGGLEIPVKSEDFVKKIAESDITYNDKKQALEIMGGFVNYISSFVKETNQGYTCKIKLNKSMLETLFKLGNIEMPDELKGISVDVFDLQSEDVYKKDGSGTSNSDAKIKLSRLIPLNNKTRIGELTLNLSANGIRKSSKNKVTAPEKFVSLEYLTEKFDELWNEY